MDKCRTEDEINKFVDDNVFYYITQETLLDKRIYEHNAYPKFQDPNDKTNYFPMVSQTKSIMYKTLP